MTIQSNIEELDKALQAVKEHCMCLKFEDLGEVYRVIYPEGMYPNGVQGTYNTIGKKTVLERMLAAMEKHWQDNVVH